MKSTMIYECYLKACMAAKYYGIEMKDPENRPLEYYDIYYKFRYAHPTLDAWIYTSGLVVVSDGQEEKIATLPDILKPETKEETNGN